MGIIQSQQVSGSIFPEQSREINQQQFQVIPNYSYTHQTDPYYGSNYKIIVHKQRYQFELQKYELFFNTYEQYKAYQDVYEWRNKSKYLVHARAIKQRINNKICGNFHQASIFIQRIPIRACQIMDIPIQQGLYLLYSCCMGFRKIYERTGYFDISLDMICINKQAIVKIWLNNNLSKIYPQFYSLDHNYTQADFIYKILSVVQPLIDFVPINQKFSDFLKNCNLSYQSTPKKQIDNKFCKIARYKEAQNSNKKQSESNLGLLTFDKIIQYFQGYLSKHKLVVARQMKSIKDLFKIQTKIQYKDSLSPRKKVENIQIKQKEPQKLQMLLITQRNNEKKNKTKRNKNTKRTNKKLMTDRSNELKNDLIINKSDQYVKNIKNLKEPDFFNSRQPSISYGYKPINTARPNLNSTRNQYQVVYSPQHLTNNQFFLHSRQRIKTTYSPNISFSIKPNDAQIQSSLSPHHSYKSTQNFFMKKKPKQSNLEEQLNLTKQQTLRRQSFPSKIEIKGRSLQNMQLKNKNQKQQIMSPNKKQSIKINNIQNKRKTYFAVQKQVSIDQQIAHDLQRFSICEEQ